MRAPTIATGAFLLGITSACGGASGEPPPSDAATDAADVALDGGEDIAVFPDLGEGDTTGPCPSPPAPSGGDCGTPGSVACPFDDACPDGGARACIARCFGGHWSRFCKPCESSAGACPAEVPKHDAPCSTPTLDAPCTWDFCAKDNEFFAATCVDGRWRVDAFLCDAPCATGGQNLVIPCFGACVDEKPCGLGASRRCSENSCKHEPFSCACAGSLCGPNLVCTAAHGGKVECRRPLSPVPGSAVPIVTDQPNIAGIVVDEAYVYWTTIDVGSLAIDSRVSRAPLDGSGKPATIGTAANIVGGFAVDTTHLYFSDPIGGRLVKVPKGGGTAIALVEKAPLSAFEPTLLALDPTSVYFVTTTGRIAAVSKDGGSTTTLSTGETVVGAIVRSGAALYWTHPTPDGFSGPGVGTVRSLALPSGAPTTLASALDFPRALATDAVRLYWAGSGAIFEMPVGGGKPSTFTATTEVGGVAADATDVFWTEGSKVMRRPKVGGASLVIGSGQVAPGAIVTDATHVYWTTRADAHCGVVWRATK